MHPDLSVRKLRKLMAKGGQGSVTHSKRILDITFNQRPAGEHRIRVQEVVQFKSQPHFPGKRSSIHELFMNHSSVVHGPQLNEKFMKWLWSLKYNSLNLLEIWVHELDNVHELFVNPDQEFFGDIPKLFRSGSWTNQGSIIYTEFMNCS